MSAPAQSLNAALVDMDELFGNETAAKEVAEIVPQPNANGEFASPLDGALFMASFGIPQIRLRPLSKVAVDTGWPELATTNVQQIRKWANENPGCNFGSVAKKGERFVFEIDTPPADTPNAIERFKKAGGTFTAKLTVRSRKGRGHCWYKSAWGVDNIKQSDTTHGDFSVRVNNQYGVSPGSVHPDTNEQYRVVAKEAPEQPSAEEIAFWQSEKVEKKSPEVANDIPRDASGKYPHGTLHGVLLSEAGRLREKGYSVETIKLNLREYAENECAQPIDFSKVDQIAESMANYKEGQNTEIVLTQAAPLVAAAKAGENRSIIQKARESAEKFDMDSILFDPAAKHAPHESIFENFITVGDLAVVIGAKKAEKSLFGLRWAMHIACGKTWCGFVCARARRVAYLDAENDEADVSDRWKSLLSEFSPEEQLLIPKNLIVVGGRKYTTAGGSLDYLQDQFWDTYAKLTKGCEIHFLDCLYMFHDKESYDNNGLRDVLDVLRYRVNSTGGDTVVILHHSRSLSNDDLKNVGKLTLERLGAPKFSETSYGGKVLLKNATMVACLDKQAKHDEDGEVESEQIHFQFFGRRVRESALLRFEDSDGKYARRLVLALSKGARNSVLQLRTARGDGGSWATRGEAEKDLKCPSRSAYRFLDELIAKEYLVRKDGRYHLNLTLELTGEISRIEDHDARVRDAASWLRVYVKYPMKAENVIEAGDEQGHARQDLIEARAVAGLVEYQSTDADMGSTLMWRPRKKPGLFGKGSDFAKQAAAQRWVNLDAPGDGSPPVSSPVS